MLLSIHRTLSCQVLIQHSEKKTKTNKKDLESIMNGPWPLPLGI